MKKQVETVLIFLFLSFFSLVTIYPVLNILGVSLRTDNAFQSRSLSLIEVQESYTDLNNDGQWNTGEPFTDTNNNSRWDSGSSLKSYFTLFTETDFLLWARNSIFVSLLVTLTGVTFASKKLVKILLLSINRGISKLFFIINLFSFFSEKTVMGKNP